MRTLLIDGDIFVVSTLATHEVETDWGDDQWTLHCDVKAAKAAILQAIENIKRELDADDAIICLSMGEVHGRLMSASIGLAAEPIRGCGVAATAFSADAKKAGSADQAL
ncbi:hypothetical protein J4T85_005595 [Sinorhizobium medicae]|uniref:hypothetical protein n=1 Tax=Sinorhizobium medicae TaxID=110321 RepID=UPI001AAE2D16|nr:hypothetical protein [Sinorhizobium medicae]MBO1962595.1 hypothetical protein [Sinorhizobium medicae]